MPGTQEQEQEQEQLLVEHKKHTTKEFTDVICVSNQKCYWCEVYRDIDCEACECQICKCTECGILCYSTFNREVVPTCTCTKNKQMAYTWYDGHSPDTCNLHNTPLVPKT